MSYAKIIMLMMTIRATFDLNKATNILQLALKARLPRDAPSIPSITAGKARSEIKVKASEFISSKHSLAAVFRLNICSTNGKKSD